MRRIGPAPHPLVRDLLSGEVARPLETHHFDHIGLLLVFAPRPDKEVGQHGPRHLSTSNTGFSISNAASGITWPNIFRVVVSVPKARSWKSESTGTGRRMDTIRCSQACTHSYPRRLVVNSTTPKNR